MGPSLHDYVRLAAFQGGRGEIADELWAVNALGDVLQCDRIFHMDDVRVQEARAAEKPSGNIASMLRWLKTHAGPIYTSRVHPDYPGLVEYPLAEVLTSVPTPYFNSTVAYAVAYAIHLQVQKISLYGIDFTYPNAHHAEKGRACVEFWLGIATARGIQLRMPQSSSLMDACVPAEERLYGYDTLNVEIGRRDGQAVVSFSPRESVPTGSEMEQRYDHSVHPNPLVSGEAA